MAKFSIYSPTYNAGNFIHETINSVLSQLEGDFEWYIHDDGSTDNTYEILQEYARADARIILERGENRTSLSAMNRFMKEAKGDYIAFIDHDDLWSRDYLKNVYEHLEKSDAEMAITSYTLIDEAGAILDWYTPKLNDRELLSQIELKKRFLTTYEVEGFRWNKIIRADVLQNNNIRIEDKFPGDIYMEYRLLQYINKAIMVDENGYYYRQSPHSQVGTVNPQNTKGMLMAYRTINQWAKVDGLLDEGDYYHKMRYICNIFNTLKTHGLSKAQLADILKEFSWDSEIGMSFWRLLGLFSRYKNLREGSIKLTIKALCVRWNVNFLHT